MKFKLLFSCFPALLILSNFGFSQPFQFKDVGKESGLLPAASKIMGHGAGWGDVNNDGWPDLYIATFHYKESKANLLFLNKEGKFELDELESTAISSRGTGVVLADFDNDGDLDIYMGSMPAPEGSRLAERQGHAFAGCSLLQNEGKGNFVNITKGNGACPEAFGGRSAAVFDYDGDGRLDLLVGEDPIPGYNGSKTASSRLFRNLGDMKFKDVTQEVGIPKDIPGLGVAVGDLNLDTWPDILIASTKGNYVFLNDGKGKFSHAAGASEVMAWPDAKGDDMVCGASIGDINVDGLPDIVLGQHFSTPWRAPKANRLYLNKGVEDGTPTFEDVTEEVGLVPLTLKAPHLEIQDFDNDGNPDLYASLVKFDAEGRPHPLIFRNHGKDKKGKFRFSTETLAVNDFPTPEDQAIKRSGTFFEKMVQEDKIIYFAPGPTCDFNRDGKLDMVLPCWWTEKETLLLQNETESGNWLNVILDGEDGINSMGVGARIELYQSRRAGKEKYRIGNREIAVGFGYASGQEAVAHFGLGKLKICDVVVTLPHNQGTIIRSDVKANQRLKISTHKKLREAYLETRAWPPELNGFEKGYTEISSGKLLQIPASISETMEEEGVAPFIMATTPPKVELALHDNLGDGAINRRLWSSWGDICVAKDGSVYVGIGDHGDDAGGDGRCYIYQWDPKQKKLQQIVDMGKVVPHQEGQPAWTKVHAKIDEGEDGCIYFSCTLNAGNRAGDPKYQWTKQLTGGQLYRYDPKKKKVNVFKSLPAKRCTATSLFDSQRNIWWTNLEAGEGNALYALDIKTKKVVHQTPDGTVTFNRSFALLNDGSILYNGPEGRMHRLDGKTGKTSATKILFPDGSPGIRAATCESKDGYIYGAIHKTNQLYAIHPEKETLELLGPTWGTGQYTTVMVLSPDERFLYYLPGAHGKAWTYGTPVIQYDLKKKVRKVLAFLGPAMEEEFGYVPGGTYGVKLSHDGSTLYVNFNGHLEDALRPSNHRPIGYGLCSFAAIHIPETER